MHATYTFSIYNFKEFNHKFDISILLYYIHTSKYGLKITYFNVLLVLQILYSEALNLQSALRTIDFFEK